MHLVKRCLFFYSLLKVVCTASAQPADTLLAKKVAANFFYINTGNNYRADQFRVSNINYDSGSLPVYYVLSIVESDGFIIVSADRRMYPVLAYSAVGHYFADDRVTPRARWMNQYSSDIKRLRCSDLKLYTAELARNTSAWLRYSNDSVARTKRLKATIGPLIQSKWAQGGLFNGMCPADPAGPAGHVMVGCVATAMGQVMRYYNYPDSGIGVHSYTHQNYGFMEVDFGRQGYDWSSMPHIVTDYRAELNKLLYHCGVACNMNYGPDGSSAYTSQALSSLISHFKYSRNACFEDRSNYVDADWIAMIKKELDAGRPIQYAGFPGTSDPGHAFICDGYQNTPYFLHFNWGWAGNDDGFYFLNDLTPDNYNFNYNHDAVIGLEPLTDFTGLDCSSALPVDSGQDVSGTTADGISYINNYNYYKHYTGKELVFSFSTMSTGDIFGSFQGSDFKMNLLMLSGCSPDSILLVCDSVFLLDDAPPGEYFIVVDSKYGYEGDFTMNISYPASPVTNVPLCQIPSVLVYPVPASKLLYVTAMNGLISRLTLESIQGLNLSAFDNINPSAAIDVSALTDGVYLLKICISGEQITKKIIILNE